MIILPKKIGGEPPLFFSYKPKILFRKRAGENIFFFISGRNAILEIIKKEKISEIFIPSYYCYPVYNSIKSLDNTIVHNYSSRNELISKVNKIDNFKKKLIIFLVFNGLQKTLNEYLNLTELKGQFIVKIVDAAMTASFSVKNFNYDYLVTNPRKFYRKPYGGLVFTKNNFDFKFLQLSNPIVNFVYLLAKIFSRLLLVSRISLLEHLGLIVNNYAENYVPENLDFLTYFFLKNIKIYDFSKKRIEQYNLYFRLLNPIKNLFLYDFLASNDDCPFGFILKTHDREDLCKYLAQRRIYVSRLWQLPSNLRGEIKDSEINEFKDIILLPIGSQFDSKQIKKVCKVVLKYFSK